MNIFFRMGRWWEDRRAVKKVEFEERLRHIERAQEAQIEVSKSLMDRAHDERSVKEQLHALRSRIDKLESVRK
jgi:hypothetical protein